MATRATYTFAAGKRGAQYDWSRRPSIHTYIHYDGYPIGAAVYFKAMLNAIEEKDRCRNANRGGAAENFIRANRLAELTSDWKLHGDTDFHYQVEQLEDGLHLEAYRFYYAENGQRNKARFFEGKVQEFVAKYDVENSDIATQED